MIDKLELAAFQIGTDQRRAGLLVRYASDASLGARGPKPDLLRKLEDFSRTLRVSSRLSCNESGCTDQRGSSNQNDNYSLVHEGQPSEAAPQTRVDTNRTNFHEFVLIRVIRVLRKLDLSPTCFEIQVL